MTLRLKCSRTTRLALASFRRDERGATAIEYALIASLVAVVIIGAVTALGGTVSGMFNSTATAIQ